MGRFGAAIRRFLLKLVDAGRRFMQGRYGTDKLNTAILVAGVICCFLPALIPVVQVKLFLMAASYVLMGWALFRMCSRNTYKRYQENRKYLRFVERLKDRQNKYFDCPRCRQTVRVPRKKGKVSITCPKCGEKFIRKT